MKIKQSSLPHDMLLLIKLKDNNNKIGILNAKVIQYFIALTMNSLHLLFILACQGWQNSKHYVFQTGNEPHIISSKYYTYQYAYCIYG